jgi:hypothetical protein
MSGRKHDEAHKIEVLNSFADNENIFIEYAHSAILTGKISGDQGDPEARSGQILHDFFRSQ